FSAPFFFFLLILLPPRSTLFPTRRSSDLLYSFALPFAAGYGGGKMEAGPRQDIACAQSILPGRCAAGYSCFRPCQYRIIYGTAGDRKSTRLNSSHRTISYAVFCLKKKK